MKKFLFACALALLVSTNSQAGKPLQFKARLEGFNAGGAPVNTIATGQAKLEVIDDGSALKFRVNVENLDNLFMAHIHVADAPVMLTDPAGPPVFWFNGGPPPGGAVSETINGRLSQGYLFTEGQLDSPRPDVTTVEELIDAISQGRASVIVHTTQNVAGELRGTLK